MRRRISDEKCAGYFNVSDDVYFLSGARRHRRFGPAQLQPLTDEADEDLLAA